MGSRVGHYPHSQRGRHRHKCRDSGGEPGSVRGHELHSIQDRNDDRKRASDAWDLYRRIEEHNRQGELSHAVASGAAALAPLVAASLDKVFRSDVTRTRRWTRGFRGPAWAALLTDDVLIDTAMDVIDGLAHDE